MLLEKVTIFKFGDERPPPFELRAMEVTYWRFERPASWQNTETGGWNVIGSSAFICPVCLDRWATREVEGTFPLFTIFSVFCVRHASCADKYDDVPGSILSETFDPLLPLYLPADLLKRELLLHINHAERIMKKCQSPIQSQVLSSSNSYFPPSPESTSS